MNHKELLIDKERNVLLEYILRLEQVIDEQQAEIVRIRNGSEKA